MINIKFEDKGRTEFNLSVQDLGEYIHNSL